MYTTTPGHQAHVCTVGIHAVRPCKVGTVGKGGKVGRVGKVGKVGKEGRLRE
jgi:hypothetical protein